MSCTIDFGFAEARNEEEKNEKTSFTGVPDNQDAHALDGVCVRGAGYGRPSAREGRPHVESFESRGNEKEESARKRKQIFCRFSTSSSAREATHTLTTTTTTKHTTDRKTID